MGIFKFRGKFEFLDINYPCKIVYNGIEFKSVKAAYAAIRFKKKSMQRMVATADENTIDNIVERMDCGPIITSTFYEYQYDVLLELQRIKFSNPELREKLVDTDPHDIVFIKNNTRVLGIFRGEGSDYVGKSLMEVRSRILKGEEKYNGNEEHEFKYLRGFSEGCIDRIIPFQGEIARI